MTCTPMAYFAPVGANQSMQCKFMQSQYIQRSQYVQVTVGYTSARFHM